MTRPTTTKGGYRGDNIDDVGAHYRQFAALRQAILIKNNEFLFTACFYIKTICYKNTITRDFYVALQQNTLHKLIIIFQTDKPLSQSIM